MTDERAELKPCPWCGQELGEVSVSEGSTFRWRKVDGCCTDGPEVRHNTMADDQVAAEAESRAKAIEAWNTRASAPQAPAPWLVSLIRWLRTMPEASALYFANGMFAQDCINAAKALEEHYASPAPQPAPQAPAVAVPLSTRYIMQEVEKGMHGFYEAFYTSPAPQPAPESGADVARSRRQDES